eukprot:gene2471-5130_t
MTALVRACIESGFPPTRWWRDNTYSTERVRQRGAELRDWLRLVLAGTAPGMSAFADAKRDEIALD